LIETGAIKYWSKYLPVHPLKHHRWYNCRALAVTAIAVHRTIATAIDIRLDYGWLSLSSGRWLYSGN